MGLECGCWKYLVGGDEARDTGLDQDVNEGPVDNGEPFKNCEGNSTVLHFRKIFWF